ncbi:hypothetical protein BST63_02165 [Bradyrhizobium canariense]|uniref:Uncharacterized protein n=1 Tax=Bradyrhizobium canariense TaxID=255045 RepID=A0ABX3XAK4_9BRAD|nr:hypothetical protein [Bradyrhizobium canariense]OSJ19519.1 hypothetical protein BSR47_02480 [Bradyrhizobium canariense]OSJ35291.1 hypothetical protein BST63_02165 [Bradyrhizobium canariense]
MDERYLRAVGPVLEDLDAAADQAIAVCGRNARETVKILLTANEFLQARLDEHRSKVATGRPGISKAGERKDEPDV